ncbi:M20 family metallopeptidase [Chloroflexota bacterium]
MSVILEHLLQQEEDMIRMLEQLVMLESPTSERSAVTKVGDFLVDAFGALGCQVERLPQVAFADHVRVTCGQSARRVLLLGHMDTVWPMDEALQRPFQAVHDKDTGLLKGTGPGIFDMKGGLVVGFYAVSALQELGLEPAINPVFLFNSDEEVGSTSSRKLIEKESEDCEVVLVLEPSRDDALVIWRKGVGRFEMEIQGIPSHSGAAHERGASAVKELAEQVLLLESMTDYERGTTVNVGVVGGGSRVNVRPACAWAHIDLRVMTAKEGRRLSRAILGLRPTQPGTSLVVSGGMNRPPWEASAGGNALFERARRVAATLGMDVFPAGGGGGSDGNFTAALGVPTLDGLGVVGNDAHALTEWVDLASLPRRAALLAELLMDLGQ